MIRLAALATALLILAAACTSDDASPDSGDSPAPGGSPTLAASVSCEPARSGEAGARTILHDGIERAYILAVPEGYDGSKGAPLLIALHGLSSTKEAFDEYSQLSQAGTSAGYVVAVPDGTQVPPRWNDEGGSGGADDVGFVETLIAGLEEDLCIDRTRVYLAGFSNGGGMAQRVACELPGRVAAIGVVAATFQSCNAPVPMVAFHGMADPLVPFEGGVIPPERGGGEFPLVPRAVSEWARAQGCDGLATISRRSQNVELSTYRRCNRGDGEVLLYSIIRGGHTWPGAIALDPTIVGATTDEIDASETMIEFFDAHPSSE